MRSEKGWTFIELMVVIVIVGILAGAGVTVFSKATSLAYLNSAAELLRADLVTGKQVASGEGTRYSFIFLGAKDSPSSARDSYQMVKENTGEVTLRQLPGRVRVAQVNFWDIGAKGDKEGEKGNYTNTVSFAPSSTQGAGIVTPRVAGTITLSDSRGKEIYVKITPNIGRIAISQKPPPKRDGYFNYP